MIKAATISAKDTKRIHRAFSRQQQQYEKAAAKAIYIALRDQIRQFINASRDYPTGLERQAVNEISALGMAKAYRRIALKVGGSYIKTVEAEITAEESGQKNYKPSFSVKAGDPSDRDMIEAYLRLYGAQKVTGITETTRKWIVEQIIKGQQAGLTFEQVAKTLINDQIHASRALRIARTETVQMMNLGRYLAANKSNFQKEKIWISAHDARVRPSNTNSRFDHHDADIQKVDLEDAFEVSREHLMFPGDTSLNASAGNTINCRCTIGLVTKRDEDGRMIVKPRPMIVTETGLENFPNEVIEIPAPPKAGLIRLIQALINGAQLGTILGLSFLDLFNNR